MTTIAFKPGAAEPLALRPNGPDGLPAPLPGTALELRIQAGTACITLPGVLIADAHEVDLNALDLPPRLYRASIYYDEGAGMRWRSDLYLNILGGC